MSKAVKNKLLDLKAVRPSACRATSHAALKDKLVRVLGIDHRQLPGILKEAKLKIVEDPTTNMVRLTQVS